MRKLTLLGFAAILASTAALPSLAQAAGCAQFDPNCATYPMPKADSSNPGIARADMNRSAAMRDQHHARYRADRTMQRDAMNDRRYDDRDDRGSGFWPGDVAAGAVDAGVGIAAGAVNTAGAIATAPFRAADNSYAYYNGGYSGWDNQSYAERNGFVCTPGTWFKGSDGRAHICQ